MPNAPTRRPRDETARLGDEIYERDIRREVEADHHGEVVAIDVDSGSWATGEEVFLRRWTACGSSVPEPSTCCVSGLGHRALVSFGGHSLRSAEVG